ncbi:hypothetical protein [Rhodococcus sp. ACS1]|uniref:hypothetical protein n=1 Tax=Rhodococcus sp. ACS1 TaxID=2028570 RepID=UPI0015C9E9DC|nr:hypothetical protein [Rhodococcus sp. ACS1]
MSKKITITVELSDGADEVSLTEALIRIGHAFELGIGAGAGWKVEGWVDPPVKKD